MSNQSGGKSQITSFIPSVFILIINTSLRITVRRLAIYERHETFTAFTNSIALKLTISQTIASAALTLVVNRDSEKWFDKGGLVEDASYIILTDAFLTPFLKFIDIASITDKIQKCLLRRKIKKSYVTQADANKIWEFPELDMAETHAQLMKTMAITFIYAPIAPMSFIISAVGIFLRYWADKNNLLRRQSMPLKLSEVLNDEMIDNIPYMLILYGGLGWWFYDTLESDAKAYLFAGFMLSCAYVAFPIHNLFSFCFSDKAELYKRMYSDAEFKYEHQACDFVDDYDRANPVTSEEGQEYYENLVNGNQGLTKDEEQQDNQKPKTSKKKLGSALNNYVNNSEPLKQKSKANVKAAGILGVLQNKQQGQQKGLRLFNGQVLGKNNSQGTNQTQGLNKISVTKSVQPVQSLEQVKPLLSNQKKNSYKPVKESEKVFSAKNTSGGEKDTGIKMQSTEQSSLNTKDLAQNVE